MARLARRGLLALGAPLLGVSASLPAQTIAVTGGRVFPVSGPVIENGTVLIRDGRITAVGANVAVPAGAQRIDASGKWVTPGIFNAATTLGVSEIGQIPGTFDATAAGERGIAAAFTPWTAINPASPLLQVTRNDGITTVGVVPRGGLVSGQSAVLQLSDGRASDMVLRAPAAMLVNLTAVGPNTGASRGELLQRLRTLLDDTRQYMRRRDEYERAATRPFAARQIDLQAMIPVIQGQIPLAVNADRASDIEAALDLARDYGLRLVITGGAEAWQIAPRLAAARTPVLVGALNDIPQSFASLGVRQDNAALLRRAGVPVIISGGADAFNARNVKYEAGVAVSFGLSWDDALRAVTLTPAEAFGVAERMGTLTPGKDATLVVWSGDPFELSTRAEQVLVRGVSVKRPSRQDELMQRYRTLPPNYRRP